MFEELEEERRALIHETVRQALYQQARGNMHQRLQQSGNFEPRRGGNGWRFGMVMGIKPLAG